MAEKTVFSARVESVNSACALVTIFNNGRYSGTLVVNADDLHDLLARIPENPHLVDTIPCGKE